MAGKPIIVGTDGSEESMRAVEWAAREAALRGSPLRMAQLEPALALDTQLLSGRPARTLAETTAGASMLVIGSRGAGGFAAIVVGSVSRYAATHGLCPVVVSRQETTSVDREIVVGVGDPDQSAAALGFAFEEASLRNARLTVAHAWSCYLPALGPARTVTAAEWAAANSRHLCAGTGARLQDMLAGWQEKYPAVETSTEIMHAHPAHLLTGASARAGLVVLGRRTSGPDDSGVGSVIHAVLHHARGPIAVVAG